ncbi:MAG: response regulator [Planctomycetes bacterium]|nr:response regulator [Planctomycetota bacterium]
MTRDWTPQFEITLPERSASFPLRQAVSIGSSPRCHLRFRQSDVPPLAGHILPGSDGVFFQPETPAAFTLNGSEPLSRTRLLPGDVLELVPVAVTVRISDPCDVFSAGAGGFAPLPDDLDGAFSPGCPAGLSLVDVPPHSGPADALDACVDAMNAAVADDAGSVDAVFFFGPVFYCFRSDAALRLPRDAVRRSLADSSILVADGGPAFRCLVPVGSPGGISGAALFSFPRRPDRRALERTMDACRRLSVPFEHDAFRARIRDIEPVYRSLLTNTVTGMLLVDSSGVITHAAPLACTLLDTEPLPPIGRDIFDFFPETVLGNHHIMQILHKGHKTFQVTSSPDDHLPGWFVEVSDISRIEEAQHQTDLAYEVYRQTPDITFVLDPGLQIRQASVLAEKNLGNCVGRNLHEYCRAFELFELLDDALARKNVSDRTVDCSFTAPSGEKIPVRAVAFLSTGQGLRIFLHARDLREILKIQETALAQERMASVGILAAGVAHEFNNLLATLEGYAELAMRSDRHAAMLPELVVAQSRRAAEIVQGLLSFGREISTRRVSVDVNRIVDEIALLTAGDFVAHKVRLTVDTSDVPPVAGNPRELQQVFMNIIINARQAIGQNGRVSVSTKADGPWIVVSVRDDGKGMSSEIRDKIFLPFFTTKGARGESRLDSEEPGTGLGLSLAYNIVKSHGGTISVDSAPGKGTEFIIRLPAAERRSDAAPGAGSPASPAGHVRPAGLRIFVVEDEPDIRSLISDALSDDNEIILCKSADEALQRIKNASLPDVILLDLTMAGETDGFGFFDFIRNAVPSVPVVLVTGRLDDDLVDSYRKRSDGFLGKPFSLDSLERVISSATSAPAASSHPVQFLGNLVVFTDTVSRSYVDSVRANLRNLLETGKESFTLDLSALPNASSTVVGIVASFAGEASNAGRSVTVRCSGSTLRSLRSTGIEKLPHVKLAEAATE